VTTEPPRGPFSLNQALWIQDCEICPYCGWKRGDMHPNLLKPICPHQTLAGEVIRGHMQAAENNVIFITANELAKAEAML
jgi:hypothetical protein